MADERGKTLTRGHEGERTRAYRDTRGNWTVGVGHLIVNPIAIMLCENWLSTAWDHHVRCGTCTICRPHITKTQMEDLYEKDYSQAKKSLDKILEGAQIGDAREAALTDMIFNLGLTQILKGFPRMVAAIKSGDWNEAADQAILKGDKSGPSDWALQVKEHRAGTIAQMLRTNEWPGGV